MSQRTNQGGSVVTFVIVGVVLAALVGGGIYLVNQRNKQNPTNQSPTGTNQPTQNPAEQQPSGSSQTNETNNGTTGTTGTNGQSDTQQTTPQTSTPSTGVSQPASEGGHLPTTGPADTALQLLAAAILIGMTTAYVRSYVQKHQPASL